MKMNNKKDSKAIWQEIYLNTKYQSDSCQTYCDVIQKEFKPDLQQFALRVKNTTKTINCPLPDNMSNLAIKDDISIMNIATFALSNKINSNKTELFYAFNQTEISIYSDDRYGLATHFDYDIIIFIKSYLTEQMNQIKKIIEHNQKTDNIMPDINIKLPSRTMTFNVDDFLEFSSRKRGGNQYQLIKESLLRLLHTKISIKNYNPDGGYS